MILICMSTFRRLGTRLWVELSCHSWYRDAISTLTSSCHIINRHLRYNPYRWGDSSSSPLCDFLLSEIATGETSHGDDSDNGDCRWPWLLVLVILTLRQLYCSLLLFMSSVLGPARGDNLSLWLIPPQYQKIINYSARFEGKIRHVNKAACD